jgi:hypothetical protein
MTGRLSSCVAVAVVAIVTASAATAQTRPAPAAAKAASAAPATTASAASAPMAASAPVEFTGSLEPGTSYVADMTFDARALKTWRPVRDVIVGKNSAWTIDWLNLDRFAQLKSPAVRARPQRFQFRVVRADVSSGSPVLPWVSTYRCEIVSVEPVAAAGPTQPAAKKR